MLHQLHHYVLYSIERVGKVHESTQVPYAFAKVPMTPRGYGEMWPAWPQMSGMSGLPAIPGNLPMRWLPLLNDDFIWFPWKSWHIGDELPAFTSGKVCSSRHWRRCASCSRLRATMLQVFVTPKDGQSDGPCAWQSSEPETATYAANKNENQWSSLTSHNQSVVKFYGNCCHLQWCHEFPFLFPSMCKIDCSVLVPLTFCVHTPSKHSASHRHSLFAISWLSMSLCAKILGFDFHKITWNPVDFNINLVEVYWVQVGTIIALPQLLVAAAHKWNMWCFKESLRTAYLRSHRN